MLFEFWKARHDPIKELGLINKQYGNLPMSAALLYDERRAADPLFGGIGRALQKAA